MCDGGAMGCNLISLICITRLVTCTPARNDVFFSNVCGFRPFLVVEELEEAGRQVGLSVAAGTRHGLAAGVEHVPRLTGVLNQHS